MTKSVFHRAFGSADAWSRPCRRSGRIRMPLMAGTAALVVALVAAGGEAHAQAQGAPGGKPLPAAGAAPAGAPAAGKPGLAAPAVAPDARREQDLARIQAMRGSPYWERVMQLQDALYIVQLERQIAEEASKKADAEAAFTQTLRGQIGDDGAGVMFNTTPDMSLLRRDATSMSGPNVMGVAPPVSPAGGVPGALPNAVQSAPLFAQAPTGVMPPPAGTTAPGIPVAAPSLPGSAPSQPSLLSGPMAVPGGAAPLPVKPAEPEKKKAEVAEQAEKPVVSGIYGSGAVLQAEIVWGGKVAFYRPGQTIIGSGGWQVTEIGVNEVVARDPKGKKVVLASQ